MMMVYNILFYIRKFCNKKIHYKNVLKNFRWSDILRTGNGTKTGSTLHSTGNNHAQVTPVAMITKHCK